MSSTFLASVVNSCEVCGSNNLEPVLDLGLHPLCDDLIPITEDAECQRYPIEIMYCRKCNTAHQKYQVQKNILFPQTYHYRSRFTADVLNGMATLTELVEKTLGSIEGKTVLDIGCNDGSLLDLFSKKGATTIGVEPTGAYADAEGREHQIINDFFTESIAQKVLETNSSVDVITFTNVFAHIEDLPGLLRALEMLMNENTILVVENHYLGSVLRGNQFDTFYHEHPRTYSLNSFKHIARNLDRDLIAAEFPKRYGGNIRVIIGNKKMINSSDLTFIDDILKEEADYFAQFSKMRSFVSSWKYNMKALITKLVNDHGKLKAKAFPGRAAILIALLELSNDEIECVYEKPGSLKIGHYLPGTRIPIRSDDELFICLKDTKILLNFAWHIPDEINSYLKNQGFTGKMVNIV